MNLERLAAKAASARKGYLANKKPNEYAEMVKAGELDAHLELIGRSAADYYATVMAQAQQQAEKEKRVFERDMYANRVWELTLEDIVYI